MTSPDPRPVTKVGDRVHFVIGSGECRPAEVLSLFPHPEQAPLANLIVTLDGSNDSDEGGTNSIFHTWRTSQEHEVDLDPDAPIGKPNTWHEAGACDPVRLSPGDESG